MAKTGDVPRSGQRALEVAGRIGFGVNAVQHLLIGIVALQIAWSGAGAQASQSGALATVAAQPFGRTLLWLFVAGFAGLAVVHLARAVGARGHDAASDRANAGALTVYYVALAVLAQQYAQGSGGGGSSKDVTAGALGLPGGQLLVGAVGLVIVGIGGYHVWKGVTKGFSDELDFRDLAGRSGTVLERVALFGYVTKGLALVLVGVLVVIGAVWFDPNAAGGLDTALRTLAGQPFGPWLLSVVALGLIAFAGYLVVRARRGKV
ncbi:MAG: DUF1206 domain-containing protein [Pseudonocardiaceae bacterium]